MMKPKILMQMSLIIGLTASSLAKGGVQPEGVESPTKPAETKIQGLEQGGNGALVKRMKMLKMRELRQRQESKQKVSYKKGNLQEAKRLAKERKQRRRWRELQKEERRRKAQEIVR